MTQPTSRELLQDCHDVLRMIDPIPTPFLATQLNDLIDRLAAALAAPPSEPVAKQEAWAECAGDSTCRYCGGEMCNKCGAGCWSHRTDCEHDSLERHHPPLEDAKNAAHIVQVG
ncbi:MAG TPA: hypothetical protein VK642_06310, partial [Burkholderiales bacterium]|nr:hypothetical protein [Burkholderiales bacterium]